MSDQPEIIITEFMDADAVTRVRNAFPTLYDPGLVDDPERLQAMLPGTRALIVRNRTQVREPLLAHADRLEIVGRLGVGLDNIDVPACGRRGIAVEPATGANATAVAEYVIATMLYLIRGQGYTETVRVIDGSWPRTACVGGEVGGRTLGLVGFGGVAREVARRARGLDMTVIAHDPMIASSDPIWGQGPWAPVRPVTFEDAIRQSDIISLHVPLTPATRHLINSPVIAEMKPGAVVINTARGGVIDEYALIESLTSGRLGAAALDVFESEPVSSDAGSRFEGVPNLLLTPHIAGVTDESNTRVSKMIADKVLKALGYTGRDTL